MAKPKNVHVVPHGNQWAVKKDNAERASVITKTQQQSITKAIPLAKTEKSDVVIHNTKGQIRERNSYGHDPESSKG